MPLSPASMPVLVAFHLACLGVVALAFPAPRSHAYSAFAAFFVLGFWLKFVVRLVRPAPYLEPVGQFDFSGAAWDVALLTVVAAAVGLMAARGLHLWLARRRARAGDGMSAGAPGAYVRYRHAIWIGTGATAVGLYAWNAVAAVHMTGLTPRIVLPFSGNAVLAFVYQTGLAMWLAVLVEWELARRATRQLGLTLLAAPLVEGIVNAGSLLSRSTFILRLLPYVLATTAGPRGIRIRRPWWTAAALAGGFAVSLALVMVLRVNIYIFQPAGTVQATASGAAASPAAAAAPDTPERSGPAATGAVASGYLARPVYYAIDEVSRLFIDRWTGMEGVLAVTSAERGPDLLLAALREDPAAGVNAIYQRLAHSTYEARAGFAFATLAGVVAVLAMSGSLGFVCLGMAVLGVAMIGTEALTRRLAGREILCGVVGVGLAFTLAQATFPWLVLAFWILLSLSLAALAMVQRAAARVPAPAAGA